MAPQKRAKVNMAMDTSPSAGDEIEADGDGPRGSQGSIDHIVQNMANALKESTKKRRNARREKIEKDYRLEMEQLQTSLIANLKHISSQNSALHRKRLEDLQGLLQKKAAIERDILQSTARLEKAYSNANQELRTVLAARINSLSEISMGS